MKFTSAPALREVTRWLASIMLLVLAAAPLAALAGTMTRATLAPLFPPPLMVGERSAALAAWPIFRRESAGPQLVGHVFETIDLEPTPGYSGKPINLLVALDAAGNFLDVRLLSQREPIFQSDKGKAQLVNFAAQYKGLSLRHEVQVGSPRAQASYTESRALVSGITAGTVTALAIDRSIMQSASRVALARLDAGQGATGQARAADRSERFVASGWTELVQAGLLRRIEASNREVERRFAGTAGAGRDAIATVQPQGVAIDTWFGLVNLAQAGRNLLDAPAWARVQAQRESGELVVVTYTNGRLPFAASGAGVRLRLRQGERTLELRQLEPAPGVRLAPPGAAGGTFAAARLWRSVGALPLDPAQPLALDLVVTRRAADESLPAVETAFTQAYPLAELAAWLPVAQPSAWSSVAQAAGPRAGDLIVLGAGLALLTLLLARQRWLAAKPQRLARFRVAYLVFTLVFIGWIAQAQLTVVTLTFAIEALVAGQGLAFLLADPVTVLLWAFVFVTLAVWGRGTFCGWLCPFGAMQELISMAVRRLGLKPVRLRLRLDAGLKWVKYGVLAALVGGAGLSAAWTETAVEVEPFKTAISLGFDRAWPFVVWALGCLLLSVFVFRGYCRYICPLGAALALLGRVRVFAWIPRRAECGTPCQSCRHKCDYQAIAPSGKVEYSECFQCLDCVEIYQDDKRCLPLVVERKQAAGRSIPIRTAVST